jgi:asparaginyl-tRNA synthetase
VVLEEREDDIAFLENRSDHSLVKRLNSFMSDDFIQIEYTDAVKILKKYDSIFKKPISWGVDLSSEHELFLTEKHFQAPIVIKNYPKDTKAFYMRVNDDERTVAAMDILMPQIGEIIGGSQREERLHVLDQRMQEIHLVKEEYSWYRDLRKYGTVPHSGFGLGLERLLSCITGIKNVRELIPFPRTPRNASC